jgi:hypothetical protein
MSTINFSFRALCLRGKSLQNPLDRFGGHQNWSACGDEKKILPLLRIETRGLVTALTEILRLIHFKKLNMCVFVKCVVLISISF